MSLPTSTLPELIAMRGNAAEFPENSLPGLRSALELGARHVHFDVYLSADRQPVLHADENLQRTAGLDLNVSELTLQQLHGIAVNEADRFHQRFKDVSVPTLVQAVSLLQAHAEVNIFVQLHRSSLRLMGAEPFCRSVTDVLKPIAHRCVVIADDFVIVHQMRRIGPYRVGWVLPDYGTGTALKCEALTPDFLFCSQLVLPWGTDRLWRGPWRWVITDVSTIAAAMKLSAREVRFVGTPMLRTMLREWRGISKRA